MPTQRHASFGHTSTFRVQDQFPLGRCFGVVDSQPEPPSVVRPFGLTLARPPQQVQLVNPVEFGYDHDTQVGVIRDDDGSLMRLGRHTNGQTGTVTDKGDGHGTNRDSDTDHRED